MAAALARSDRLADDTDEALVARYRRGDVAAFEALLDRHQRGVHRFLRRFLQDGTRADDLAQECWVRFIRAVPRWTDERSRFKTWLYTVARNLATDEARRRVHREQVPAAEAALRPAEGIAPGRAPDDALADARVRAALERAIAALPPDQREVFLLREYEGVPFAEIAEMTGAPVPTVKSRMRYALEALRRSLEGLDPGPGERPVAGSAKAKP